MTGLGKIFAAGLVPLVVEEDGDVVRVGDELLQHLLRDVLDHVRVLALLNPLEDGLVALRVSANQRLPTNQKLTWSVTSSGQKVGISDSK